MLLKERTNAQFLRWSERHREGWTPVSSPLFYAWYDLTDPATFTLVEGKCSQLLPKFGSAPSFSQSTADNRPTFSASVPALTFDRTVGTYMVGSAPFTTSSGANMVFAVCSSDGTVPGGTDYQRLFNNTNVSGARNFIGVDTANQIGYQNRSTFFAPTGVAFTPDTQMILHGEYDGTSNVSYSVNGGVATTEAIGSDLTAANLTLGSRVATNETWQGNISELIIYDTDAAIDAAEIAELKSLTIQFLKRKWGIA